MKQKASTRRSNGKERAKKMKYRATILMSGCIHPDGHRIRLYSDNTDEAWWMAEAMCRALSDAGLSTAINFQSRAEKGGRWVDSMPTFPPEGVF